MTSLHNKYFKSAYAAISLAVSFLGLMIFILMTENQSISFQKSTKTDSQIKVEKLVQKLNELFISNENLKNKSIIEKNSAFKNNYINQYNQLVNSYNEINNEINNSDFFKKRLELKKEFLEANNGAYPYLENTRTMLSERKTLALQINVTEYLKKYDAIKNHASLNEFSFLDYNKSTFQFLLGFAGFIFFSFFAALIMIKQNIKFNSLLIQKNSELKTFLSIIDNMSEGVIVSDRIGFFTYYNQSALDIIGSNIKDLYYQSSQDLIGFHDLSGRKLDKSETPFYKAVRKDIVTDQEILVQNQTHPSGIYISASNGFYVDEKGETQGAVVVMKNISHKKQMEELWKKEKESAINGSQKKSDFLASMSHEIRTPMNGIIGLTTLLSETQLDHEQNEFVDTIKRSAKSLLALINDILDHSKIESGKIELVKNNFDLEFLLKDVIENFKLSCAEKNNIITYELPKNFAKNYIADENRIRQILMNLVGNAAKFTSCGQIQIKISLLSLGQQENKIRFSITDTGPGMNANDLERLFQRFFQTKTGIQFGGTGLGLSICKQLVDLMNGQIGVTSQLGIGSTFWFELNLENSKSEISPVKNIKLSDFADSFSGHVLIAEDNVINQKVASQYLSKLGFTFHIANNGLEAFELFQKNKYDLVLMDCNMPLMNGFISTQKINEFQKNEKKLVKIIALTAEGQISGLQKCLDAGMSDFINKPILIEEFVSVIEKYCSGFDKSCLYKLQDLTVDDQLLLEVLLIEYESAFPKIISDMNHFYDEKNYTEISDLAHSLKSSSGTLGIKKVQSLCQKIEKNNIPNLFTDLIIQLEQEYPKSLIELKLEIDLIKKSKRLAA